jgi:hypothetical protein
MWMPFRSSSVPAKPAMTDRSTSKRRIYLVTSLALLLTASSGIILLFLAHLKWHEDWSSFFPDLLRDLGMAFIISTVVALLIEFYRFAHHWFGAMWEMLDLLMSEEITSAVWLELKDLIKGKKVIRKGVHIRLALTTGHGLPEHLRELSVEYGYSLHGLGKKRTRIELAHELDYQFAGIDKILPRFTRFTVDDGTGSAGIDFEADMKAAQATGTIKRVVWVPPRDGTAIQVWIERRELVPIPGSYNLYTPDFMKGLNVIVADGASDVRVEVWIRPQGSGEELRQLGNSWYSDELILPGQGIEVKFITGERATKQITDAGAVELQSVNDGRGAM